MQEEDQSAMNHAESVRQLRQELLGPSAAKSEMHKRGDIGDEAMRTVLRDLDLEEQRGE